MERKSFKGAVCVAAIFAIIPGAGVAVQAMLVTGPLQVSQAAIEECEHRHELGELKSNVDAAECSNSAMLRAYQDAGSLYVPVIQRIAAKRLEVARRLDRGEISKAQAAEE